MPVVRIVLLLLFLAVITPGIGAGICNYIKEYKRNVAFHFLAGFLTEWALFQLIAVPAIVMGVTFTGLSVVYGILLGLCFIAGSVVTAVDRKKTSALKVVREPFSKGEKRLWAIALAGILLQLVLAVVMAFEDGDDAFYVTTSNLSVTWDSMYRLLPYNFGSTSLDFRHCLAPFPIWIAFLSKLSGIHPAVFSHTLIPLILLPLAYCIYGLLGYRLLGKNRKKLPAFLIFAEVLILWGNVSAYTAETFLISRTRQGKALLCAIVVPAMFLLLHMLAERLLYDKKAEKSLWLLLSMAVFSAGLGSTMGDFLSPFLLGVFGLCLLFMTKRWKPLLPLFFCMVPGLCYMVLYAVVK